jgi:hypothetical protein
MSAMTRVLSASISSHKSLLNPWRSRQVWELNLACGHQTWRYRRRFAQPPRRVRCQHCAAQRALPLAVKRT